MRFLCMMYTYVYEFTEKLYIYSAKGHMLMDTGIEAVVVVIWKSD
jgi:hypothetical protein